MVLSLVNFQLLKVTLKEVALDMCTSTANKTRMSKPA